MKRRLVLFAIVLACVGLFLPGTESTQAQVRRLSLATGGVGGVYYPLGGAMAKIWMEKIPGLIVTAEATGASVMNARLVHRGEAQLALIQNDIAYYAFEGTEMFEADKALGKLRGMAVLYPEVIQIVTLKETGIKTIADLKGKRVAVGAPGSGTEANARQILELYGFYDPVAKRYTDITPEFLAFAPAAAALKDGKVDAAFLTAGIPTAAVIELAATHNVVLLPVEQDKAEALMARWPFYTRLTIPMRTYKTLEEDVPTVSVMAMLVASVDVDAELVYQMLQALFLPESLKLLCATHVRGCDIQRERALEGMSIPLHPGAERFYKGE
ncbi:MAG: TAXI family TRAP transporter solute-binding subunit [Candidatus Bipolaricaulota bacterium]|nr:TAXI family TRAP transporter solute-binding subunit [Candidatus Bipolaricaulota bacterium]MDW8127149.1 TAXI family TRAP transporter solute-binding subunit [Candidatus Bipolaricaulota bacterium]